METSFSKLVSKVNLSAEVKAMPNVVMNGKTSNAKYVTAEEGGTQVIFAG